MKITVLKLVLISIKKLRSIARKQLLFSELLLFMLFLLMQFQQLIEMVFKGNTWNI